MARTPEIEIPLAGEYLNLLKEEIGELGRDRIAKLADIDPSTVHRNINDGSLTYTTAMKLRTAIAKAHLADATKPMRFIPPPFFPVMSQSHYDLCEIAAKLHAIDGDTFGAVFEFALAKLHEAEREKLLDRAKQQIVHPIRKDTDEDDRGD